MLSTVTKAVSISLFLFLLTASMVFGVTKPSTSGKTAILLAAFGTTVPSAVQAITHISDQVKKNEKTICVQVI